MNQTSLIAFEELEHSKLSDQYQRILEALKNNGGLVNRDIEDVTGITISSITARTNELKKKGLIYVDGIGVSKITGKKGELLKIKEVIHANNGN